MKPLIGVTASPSLSKDGTSRVATLGTYYLEAVRAAGGLPVLLFDGENEAEALAARLDGLLLTGGDDVDPALFGEENCGSRDIAVAAARVKTAFSGYAKITRLTYPGDVAPWRADRAGARSTAWRLSQETSFGPDKMAFGLAGRDGPGALVAVARFADGAQPYAARLLLRDGTRSSQGYLDRWTGGSTARLPLDRRMPARSALKTYPAAARSRASQDLLQRDVKSGWAFRFPDAAAVELSKLDPREAIAVEFLFQGDVTRRAYVEVGDFAAGRAFLKVAAR